MAHESFEDPATAAVMNRLFVNIKVDREERPGRRPDLHGRAPCPGRAGRLAADHVPDARTASRSGAAPTFPKTARYGRPGFVDVLEEVARIFREEPDKIAGNPPLS